MISLVRRPSASRAREDPALSSSDVGIRACKYAGLLGVSIATTEGGGGKGQYS